MTRQAKNVVNRLLLPLSIIVMLSGCAAHRQTSLLVEQLALRQKQIDTLLLGIQDQLLDLTIRTQAISSDLIALQGRLASVEYATEPVLNEFARLRERMADIEKYAAVRRTFANMEQSSVVEQMQWSSAAEVYAAALAEVSAGNVTRATDLLQQLLRRWPQDELSVNAQYALAASLQEKGQYGKAAELLLTLIDVYPGSHLAEDAYLRLIDVLIAAGERDLAEQVRAEYMVVFPNARQANGETARPRSGPIN